MSDNQDSNIPWWAIVFGFMLFPPIGFLLLFLSLAGVKIPTQQTRRTYIPPRTAGQSQRQPRASTVPPAAIPPLGALPGSRATPPGAPCRPSRAGPRPRPAEPGRPEKSLPGQAS